MAYVKQTWANDAAGATPLSAASLNHIEDGIAAVDTSVVVSDLPPASPSVGQVWIRPTYTLLGPSSGKVAHYDASLLTGLANGDPVPQWFDAVGTNTLASANPPRYDTNVLNGKPIVHFDGTAQWLGSATVTAPADSTMMIVARLRGSTTTNKHLVNNYADPSGHVLASNASSNWQLYSGATLVGQAVSIPTWKVFVAHFAASGAEFRVHSTSYTGATGTRARNGIRLASNELGTIFSEFEVAEVAVWNRRLTGTETTDLEAALKTKWGL